MIFSTYKFLLLFLPIVLVVFRLLIRRDKILGAKLWLVAASIFFYCQGALSFAPIFLLTAIFNYFAGRTLCTLAQNEKFRVDYKEDRPSGTGVSSRKENKRGDLGRSSKLRHILFALAMLENLGLLGYFKYTNFFIDNLNRLGAAVPQVSVILPLGISFFTFNIIIYIVDSYRNKSRCYSFCDFMVFISFFPHLIMGPIVKHGAFIEQIENRESFAFDAGNFSKGLFLFAIGCAKKVIIADPLIAFASAYYANPGGGGFLEAWTAVVSYTLAYYFDFSGYGDMAVGLGLFFGVKLPVNFNSPYKARNFVDFWRRWNITLTNFLNEYIFGKVYRFGGRAGRLFLGVMVTFLVSGIWHGAGWNFIAWGLVNGVFVFMGMLMTLYNKRLPGAAAHALTLAGVLLTRVLFDSHSLSQAMVTFRSMAAIGELSGLVMFAKANMVILGLILAAMVIVFFTRNAWEHAEEFQLDARRALWTAALLTVSLFFMTNVSSFLYFQF